MAEQKQRFYVSDILITKAVEVSETKFEKGTLKALICDYEGPHTYKFI